MKSSSNVDLVVVGAGILGCSLAFHARRQGLSVIVIESEAGPACHASGRSAGQFRQLYRHPTLTEWALRSRLSWPKLTAPELFSQNGSFILGREIPAHHRDLFELEMLPKPIRLKTGVEFGVRTRTDGVITSEHVTKAVAACAEREGAEFRFGIRIGAIEQSNRGDFSLITDTGIVKAGLVALCTGAWANKLTSLPLTPFARHLVDVDGWPSNFMPVDNIGYFWDETKSWYMKQTTPSVRVVSICDQEPADPDHYQARTDIGSKTLELLREVFPAIASNLRVINSRCCFRTYAPDKLPIWGMDNTRSGLFHLTGFGGFGMSTAFAAAEDAAALITGKCSFDYSEFRPGRFSESARVANI